MSRVLQAACMDVSYNYVLSEPSVFTNRQVAVPERLEGAGEGIM
jgi:hypothetical protein